MWMITKFGAFLLKGRRDGQQTAIMAMRREHLEALADFARPHGIRLEISGPAFEMPPYSAVVPRHDAIALLAHLAASIDAQPLQEAVDQRWGAGLRYSDACWQVKGAMLQLADNEAEAYAYFCGKRGITRATA